MIDGMGQIIPLAWGTALIENAANWNWFARNLKEALGTMADVPFTVFSDREKGIETALESHFPRSHHNYCFKHIEKNIITRFRYRSELLWEAAKTLDKNRFQEIMSRLQEQHLQVHDYLVNIPFDRWSTAHASCPKWGHVTSNASESLNSWMNDIRDESFIGIHVGLIRKTTRIFHERRIHYRNVVTFYPPEIVSRLDATLSSGRMAIVIPSSERLFTVENRVVDLDSLSCSCGLPAQLQMPCKHMAAAVQFAEISIADFVHDCYRAATIKSLYGHVILPVSTEDIVFDEITQPPLVRPQAGRPRTVRIRSRSEYREEDSPVVCSLCRRRGHNRRTCGRRRN
jgi:hypothetical protein